MECNIYRTVKNVSISNVFIQSIVEKTLRMVKKKGSVSVHCIGDTKMRTLNKLYRGKDKTTDVLSFATEDDTDLGDIFISIPQIKRQSKTWGVTYKEEFVRMLVHGVLHLVGYDHNKDSDAQKMFTLQEKCIQKLI